MTASHMPCPSSPTSSIDAFLALTPLAPGEDQVAYLALRSAMVADLQPADAIEAIWARDVVDLCWELQRLARVRTDVLARGRGDVLRGILCQGLKYRSETYRRMVTLSARWSAGDPDALACVEALLARRGYDSTLLVTQVYHANLGRLEMLDRMTTRIEYRRSKLLREIDRRRRDFAQRARATIERFTPPRSRQAWPQDEGLGHTPSRAPAGPAPASTTSARPAIEPAEPPTSSRPQDERLRKERSPSAPLQGPRQPAPCTRPGFDEPRTPLASSHEPIPPAAPPRGTTVPHKPHASHPSPLPEREGL